MIGGFAFYLLVFSLVVFGLVILSVSQFDTAFSIDEDPDEIDGMSLDRAELDSVWPGENASAGEPAKSFIQGAGSPTQTKEGISMTDQIEQIQHADVLAYRCNQCKELLSAQQFAERGPDDCDEGYTVVTIADLSLFMATMDQMIEDARAAGAFDTKSRAQPVIVKPSPIVMAR